MLSNLVSQLKEAHAEDKYEQVLEEIPRVRKDFGEPASGYPVFPDRGKHRLFSMFLWANAIR